MVISSIFVDTFILNRDSSHDISRLLAHVILRMLVSLGNPIRRVNSNHLDGRGSRTSDVEEYRSSRCSLE